MYRRYGDQVQFLAVYVREAHPIDGWRMSSNDRAGIAIKQPTKQNEREAAAHACSGRLETSIKMVVDEINDRVGNAYSGMPDRLYLLDDEGKVAFKSGRGPFGFHPGELEQALLMMLQDRTDSSKPNDRHAQAKPTDLKRDADPRREIKPSN